MQEAECHIKRRTAPHFQREAICQNIRRAVCTFDHIAGTHSCGQQRLVRIAHRRIRNQQLFLIQHPIAERLRALLVQQLLEARLRIAASFRKSRFLIQLRVLIRPIDFNTADVFQNTGRTVSGTDDVKQLRCIINKFRMALTGQKRWMAQNIRDKRNIGLDAADAHFIDRAQRLAAHTAKCIVMAGHFDEQ